MHRGEIPRGEIEPRGTRSSTSVQRLFFALWPDVGCREALAKLARRLLRRHPGKAVPAENYHITLNFLGSVTPPSRACAERVADSISVSPFALSFDHAGH